MIAAPPPLDRFYKLCGYCGLKPAETLAWLAARHVRKIILQEPPLARLLEYEAPECIGEGPDPGSAGCQSCDFCDECEELAPVM